MACDEGIKLISSTKQTIIQGTDMTKPYTNYLFEITLLNTIDLHVDSVLIYDAGKTYKVNHYLSKKKNNKNYTLNASLNEGNFTVADTKSATNDVTEKAIIYYKANDTNGALNISTFKEKTITRR
ncbi:hypothetical protein [uncultured Kordia sp.]|uniref:hypothetical protein n=1 Tax=uncultured Kordia sp. TaxID=507699 RepID=UPI002634F15C|nr:hypothetical protein [uncultured Kordia sp.]